MAKAAVCLAFASWSALAEPIFDKSKTERKTNEGAPLLPPLREDQGDYYYFDGRFVERGLEAPVSVELCSDKCRPCLYKSICYGFDREYLKIFGSNEIQPVLEQGPHVL